MASLLAAALTPDLPRGEAGDARSAIERVLRATFWQTNAREGTAAVIPITIRTARAASRTHREPTRG